MTCQNTLHLIFDSSQTTVCCTDISEDGIALQENLTSLHQLEEKWQMQFHPQKCNVIYVTNKRKPITHSYKLQDHILEVMENRKYQRNLRGCKSNVKSTAYTTIMRPIFEYAGTVWDPHHHVHIRSLEGSNEEPPDLLAVTFMTALQVV